LAQGGTYWLYGTSQLVVAIIFDYQTVTPQPHIK